MLTELYQYALDKGLAARPGFKLKRLKAYLMLSSHGEFLGINLRDKKAEPVYAPDVGAAANGTRYCNPLIEKAKIPLGIVEDEKADKNIPTKKAFYLSMLASGSLYEHRFSIIAQALENESTRQSMVQALAEQKLKSVDPVGFMVDGFPMERSQLYLPWWEEFRKQFAPEQKGNLPRCLITGQLSPALATVPKVSGLIDVGGHTAGDAFLCFDKDAFQSYGLKKSANAPVSEEAMTAVNAALTQLIAEAPVLGNAKIVHWYSSEITPEEDLLPLLMDAEMDNEEPEEDDLKKTLAMAGAKQILTSVLSGIRPEALHAKYYILPLSGASGRMMVRGWYEGSYENLHRNIIQWFDDLTLVNWNGKGQTRPPKLKALCIRLLKPGGSSQKVFSRLDEELPNLLGRLLYAIIQGTALPDDIPPRVLTWIRSEMLRTDENTSKYHFEKETMAFQLLKAWLCRKQRLRGDEHPMEQACTGASRGVAYHCGQLLAVYSAIQQNAMPDVNVGVAERYYTAASANPAFAIGKLAQLSQHHLRNLEGGLAVYYQRKLSEIYVKIGDSKIPATMTMEQQTEFALGFYQQRAALYGPSNAEKE